MVLAGPVSPKDLDSFWRAQLDQFPDLAKAALKNIWIPMHSTDVERVFSTYRRLADPIRNQMSDQTAETLLMYMFNNNRFETCSDANAELFEDF